MDGVRIDRNDQIGYKDDRSFFENRIEREWLTTNEAAHFLGLSENALRIMVHRGQVPVFKFGRRLRFRLHDCRALIQKKGA
jgi:excisionase family DNA binding protein